ncbi:hypothetical protein [Brevibacterium ammoniilyticum]|uniref:hypothetical protein n=1 Tax=Brevibacterium ammoniilyticum TaxID=1046555 RepID=UPI003138FF3C
MYTVDIRDRYFPPRGGKPRSSGDFSHFDIIVVGAASAAVALYLATTDRAERWDLFLKITRSFGATLAGVIAWGIFTKRSRIFAELRGQQLDAGLS